MKRLLLLLLFLGTLLPEEIVSQIRPIQVKYELVDGEYVFRSTNITNLDHHVVVEFDRLVGYTCDAGLPFDKNIPPGSRQLFRLIKQGVGTTSNATFSYRIRYHPGKANPKINKKIVYMLPVASGKAVETFGIRHLAKSLEQEEKSPSDFYSIGFKLNEGDTIYATRGGVVAYIKDDVSEEGDNLTYSRQHNYVRVFHKDGVQSTYQVFKGGGVFVHEGEFIEAGQPIGLAGGKNFSIGHHVKFFLSYLKYDEMANVKERYSYGYLRPTFRISAGEDLMLENNTVYTSTQPEELITQEMTKREIKKRSKKKKK